MKITGDGHSVTLDLENGYVVKAEGERLTGGRFVVYTNTMNHWEPPHEKEPLSADQIAGIIQEVKRSTSQDTVQLIFE